MPSTAKRLRVAALAPIFIHPTSLAATGWSHGCPCITSLFFCAPERFPIPLSSLIGSTLPSLRARACASLLSAAHVLRAPSGDYSSALEAATSSRCYGSHCARRLRNNSAHVFFFVHTSRGSHFKLLFVIVDETSMSVTTTTTVT